MDYNKIYDTIVSTAKAKSKSKSRDCYTESHHIIPKSFGGSNKKTNLVELTAREHFVCHWLLTKIATSPEKMLAARRAFYMMRTINEHQQKRYINSRAFEYNKLKLYGKNGLCRGKNAPRFGHTTSQSTRDKQRIARKKYLAENPDEMMRLKNMAKDRTLEHQTKINVSNTGQTRTAASRKKMSESYIGKRMGADNHNARGITIEGKYFPSLADAERKTGIGSGTLRNRALSTNKKFNQYILEVKNNES